MKRIFLIVWLAQLFTLVLFIIQIYPYLYTIKRGFIWWG